MGWTEAPADKRKPPANGYSPTLPPPRHVSTLPEFRGRKQAGLIGKRPSEKGADPDPALG